MSDAADIAARLAVDSDEPTDDALEALAALLVDAALRKQTNPVIECIDNGACSIAASTTAQQRKPQTKHGS